MTGALLDGVSILLPVAISIGVIVCVFVGAALLLGLSEFIADEARGWLELTPRGILRLVAMRLPADQRAAIYSEEWLPELIFKMRKGEGRPISRLAIGAWYAISMARAAGQVSRELHGVRKPGEVPRVYVSDGDVGTAKESPDKYQDTYVDHRVPGGLRVTSEGIRFGSVGISVTASMSATGNVGGGGAGKAASDGR